MIERGILDVKKSKEGGARERKKTKEEREIINALKVFVRFHS